MPPWVWASWRKLAPDLPSWPVTPPLPPQAELTEETRTLRVGLIAGPEATWDLAAARVAEHLRRDHSLEVYHAWDCLELGLDDPTDYDCLVLLGWPAASVANRSSGSNFTAAAADRWSRCGRCTRKSPAGRTSPKKCSAGGNRPSRRCRLLEVQRSESAWHHPVVEGVETMIAEGEVYSGPRFSPDTTVLLTAADSAVIACSRWPGRKRHEGGRVFCTTLGVDDDFREPSFLRLISNAVHWAGLVHGG